MATEYVNAGLAELSGSGSSAPPSAASSAGSRRNRQLLRSYHDFAMHVFSNSKAAQEGERLFLSAVGEGDYERVEDFIKRRNHEVFNIDMRDLSTGDTPLILACRRGFTKIVQMLLRSGADVTLRNHDSETALSVSSTDTLKMLLESVEWSGRSHRNLLHAAWQGNKDVVQRLLGDGDFLDVNCENADGFTPLLLVTRDIPAFEKVKSYMKAYNPVEVVQALLAHGADPSRGDMEGWTPLHHVAACPSLLGHHITLLLMVEKENLLALDERSSAPIHIASRYGQVGNVVAFLENGLDVNLRGEAGATPLHVSAASGQLGVAHTLLDRGADVTLVDDRGNTPVDVASNRKMRATLREAWTEATQGRRGSSPTLSPVKPPSRRGLPRRHSSVDSPRDLDQPVSTNRILQKLTDAHQTLQTERQLLQQIDDGTFSPRSLLSRGTIGKSMSPSRAPAPPKTPRGGPEGPKIQKSSSFAGRPSSTKGKQDANRARQRLNYRHSDSTLGREKTTVPITVVGLGWDEEAQDIRLCRINQSTLLSQRRGPAEPEIPKRLTFDLTHTTSLQQITDVCSEYLNKATGHRPPAGSESDATPSLPAVEPHRPLSGTYRSSYFDVGRNPFMRRFHGTVHPARYNSEQEVSSGKEEGIDRSARLSGDPQHPGGSNSDGKRLFPREEHPQSAESTSFTQTSSLHREHLENFHIEMTRVNQLKESSDSGQGSTRSTNSRASTLSSLSTPSPLLEDVDGSPSRHQVDLKRSLRLQSFDSESGVHFPSIPTEIPESLRRFDRIQVLDGHNIRLINNHVRHHSDDAMSVVSVTSTATSKTADICGQRISLSHTLREESESGNSPEQTMQEPIRYEGGSDFPQDVLNSEVFSCQTDDEKLACAWKDNRTMNKGDGLVGMQTDNFSDTGRLHHTSEEESMTNPEAEKHKSKRNGHDSVTPKFSEYPAGSIGFPKREMERLLGDEQQQNIRRYLQEQNEDGNAHSKVQRQVKHTVSVDSTAGASLSRTSQVGVRGDTSGATEEWPSEGNDKQRPPDPLMTKQALSGGVIGCLLENQFELAEGGSISTMSIDTRSDVGSSERPHQEDSDSKTSPVVQSGTSVSEWNSFHRAALPDIADGGAKNVLGTSKRPHQEDSRSKTSPVVRSQTSGNESDSSHRAALKDIVDSGSSSLRNKDTTNDVSSLDRPHQEDSDNKTTPVAKSGTSVSESNSSHRIAPTGMAVEDKISMAVEEKLRAKSSGHRVERKRKVASANLGLVLRNHSDSDHVLGSRPETHKSAIKSYPLAKMKESVRQEDIVGDMQSRVQSHTKDKRSHEKKHSVLSMQKGGEGNDANVKQDQADESHNVLEKTEMSLPYEKGGLQPKSKSCGDMVKDRHARGRKTDITSWKHSMKELSNSTPRGSKTGTQRTCQKAGADKLEADTSRDVGSAKSLASSIPTDVTSDLSSDLLSNYSDSCESVEEVFESVLFPPKVEVEGNEGRDGETSASALCDLQLCQASDGIGKPLAVLDPAVVLTHSVAQDIDERKLERNSSSRSLVPKTKTANGASGEIDVSRPGDLIKKAMQEQMCLPKRRGIMKSNKSPLMKKKILIHNQGQKLSKTKGDAAANLQKLSKVTKTKCGRTASDESKRKDGGSSQLSKVVERIDDLLESGFKSGSMNKKKKARGQEDQLVNQNTIENKKDIFHREVEGKVVGTAEMDPTQETPVIVDIREDLPRNVDHGPESGLDQKGNTLGPSQHKPTVGASKKKKLTLNLGQNKTKGSPKVGPLKSPKSIKSPNKVSNAKTGNKEIKPDPKSPNKKKKNITRKSLENLRIVPESESDKTAFITGQGWEIRTSRNESIDDMIVYEKGDTPIRRRKVSPAHSLIRMDYLARKLPMSPEVISNIANIMSPLEAHTPKFIPDTMDTIKEFAGSLSWTDDGKPKDVFTFSPIASPEMPGKESSSKVESANLSTKRSPKSSISTFFPEIQGDGQTALVSSDVKTDREVLVSPETEMIAEIPKVFQLSDNYDSEDSHRNTCGDTQRVEPSEVVPPKEVISYTNTSEDTEKVEPSEVVPPKEVILDQMPLGARRAIQKKRGSLNVVNKLVLPKFGLTKAQRKILKRRRSVPTMQISSDEEDSSDVDSLASSLRRRFLEDILGGSSDEGSMDGRCRAHENRKCDSSTPENRFTAAKKKLDDEYENRSGNLTDERCIIEDRNNKSVKEEKTYRTGNVSRQDDQTGKKNNVGQGISGQGESSRREKKPTDSGNEVSSGTGMVVNPGNVDSRCETNEYESEGLERWRFLGRTMSDIDKGDVSEEESTHKEKLLHEHVQTISIKTLQVFNSILSNSEGIQMSSSLSPGSTLLSVRPSSRESQASRNKSPTSLDRSPMSEISEGFGLASRKEDSRLSEELLSTGRTNLSSEADRSHSQSTTRSESEGDLLHWKKGNVLGKGAFGTVYCGLTSTGQLIAVKRVELDGRQQAAEQYEKLQEEVDLLKTLRHKNIVGFLGVSLEDTVVNIFMQFIPGGSIASLLARFGALEEAVFCRYTSQVVQGTVYLHSNNVIHRDIKGANIMLMSNGVIKLIDFGCAKRLCIPISQPQNLLKSMKGTPYWMAPEVIMETGHGPKSDVWSVGCTVMEMATRKPPWADMPPMSAIFAIGSGETVPQLDQRFSAAARDFVNVCLTRNPEDRATSADLLQHPFLSHRRERSKESRRVSRISLSTFEEGIMFKEQPIQRDSIEKPRRKKIFEDFQ